MTTAAHPPAMASTSPDLADVIAGALIEAKKRAAMDGRGLYAADLADIIRSHLPAKPRKAKPKAGMPKPRARDAVFDALAKVDGQDLKQITRAGGARVAKAKQEILEVMNGATAEKVVAEIEERAARYRRQHPTWTLTARALATNWANLGGGPKTNSGKRDIYQEPDPIIWKSVAKVLYPDTGIEDREWSDLAPDYRLAIVDDIARNNPHE